MDTKFKETENQLPHSQKGERYRTEAKIVCFQKQQ